MRWSVARGPGAWVALSLVGVVIVGLRDDGHQIVSLSENHGPSALDAAGILFLIVGWLTFIIPLWKFRSATQHRGLLGTLVVAGAATVIWSVTTDAGLWWLLGVAALWLAQVAAGIWAIRPVHLPVTIVPRHLDSLEQATGGGTGEGQHSGPRTSADLSDVGGGMSSGSGPKDVVVDSRGGLDLHVLYCRIAAIAFFLVAVYTLAVKLPSGGLADDWLHTVLHVVTGAVASYLGWVHRGVVAPRVFTIGVIVVYGLLGVVGWFIDGIALESSFAVPLTAADNLFHLALAVVGLAIGALARRR